MSGDDHALGIGQDFGQEGEISVAGAAHFHDRAVIERESRAETSDPQLRPAVGNYLPDGFAFFSRRLIEDVGATPFTALRVRLAPPVRAFLTRELAVSLPGVAADEVPFGEPAKPFFSRSRSDHGRT